METAARANVVAGSWSYRSLYHNCDSTTTRLRHVVYDDATTHSTTTEVIEITIRLRYDYDKKNGRGH